MTQKKERRRLCDQEAWVLAAAVWFFFSSFLSFCGLEGTPCSRSTHSCKYDVLRVTYTVLHFYYGSPGRGVSACAERRRSAFVLAPFGSNFPLLSATQRRGKMSALTRPSLLRALHWAETEWIRSELHCNRLNWNQILGVISKCSWN